LPWSAYDGERIVIRQRKTRREVSIPVHAVLKTELDELAKRKRGPIIVVGERGRPYTGNGFRAVFYRHLRALRKTGKVEGGLKFHGLRHTLGTALAEAGASTRIIASVLGHASEAMSAHYSRRAETGRQAAEAIRKLEQK
jgi:integrase